MSSLSTMQGLLDHAAVVELVQRYTRGADRHDEAILRSCYHDDSTDDHGYFRGNGQAFVSWMMSSREVTFRTVQHLLGQIIVEVDGDSAESEAWFVATHVYEVDGQARMGTLGGRYVDTVTRRNSVWRIAARTVVIDWSSDRPAETEFPRVELFVTGRRNGQDFSYARPHRASQFAVSDRR